jgi:hypothetical protein
MDSYASSAIASLTSRTDRSLSSCGYFLGAGMTPILSGNQTLHRTRGDSLRSTAVLEGSLTYADPGGNR